jgi:ATP-dependent helicase HrpB
MDSVGLSARLGAVNLPLAPRLGEIRAALDRAGVLVLRADPGSGKSTLTPLALLAARPAAGNGPDILMLEPRRAAVLGIAGRMAELLGERVGERAGYAVRMERRVSSRTRIEVLTEGLLVRRLQRSPQLPAVRTVIFDEFHERSIHSDLALALVLDLRRMGSPLQVLIMSATMDAAAVARHITAVEARGPEVPVIDCPGRAYPVTIRHWPLPRREGLGRECAVAIESLLDNEYECEYGARGGAETRVTPPSSPSSGESDSRAAPPGCEAAVASSPPPPPMVPAGEAGGDMLVFLPGRREIEEARLALRNAGFGSRSGRSPGPQDPADYRRDFEVLVLYGGLPLDRQREIIAPRPGSPRKRRIILSTNVAETGLTIPGITVVVDSGFARIAGFHLPSGMNRLQLEPISRASAEQRAGRAGRLGPGFCLRLWREGDLRPDETGPELRRSDLSSLVLECFLWGVRDRLALPWLEAPPRAAWDRGRELLVDLGAVDREDRPTEKGRTMARLGLDCRLAALCAGAGKQEALGCAAAAVLSDRDAPGLGEDADFRERLSLLRRGLAGTARSGEPSPEGRDAWIRRTAELGEDLLRRLGGGDRPLVWSLEEEAAVGELLAGAFPDRIGRRQEAPQESRRGGIQGVYRFSSGRDALLSGPLAASEWIVAAEIDAGERAGSIRLAAPLSPQGALDALGSRITARYLIRWKEPLRELAPRGVLVKKAGGIPISEERGNPPREAILPALTTLLTEGGIDLLPWDQAGARRLLDRIRFLAAHPAAAPAEGPVPLEPGFWTDGALVADLGLWLGPFIREGESPVIGGGDLRTALAARLGWDRMEALERLVPDQFRPPARREGAAGPSIPPQAGGRRPPAKPPRSVPIDYGGGEPVVRLRLQDALGITGPREILGVPLVFQLLSPAGRPIQITRDLPGFWKGSYAEVRKEMRGRYPKHDWPEL